MDSQICDAFVGPKKELSEKARKRKRKNEEEKGSEDAAESGKKREKKRKSEAVEASPVKKEKRAREITEENEIPETKEERRKRKKKKELERKKDTGQAPAAKREEEAIGTPEMKKKKSAKDCSPSEETPGEAPPLSKKKDKKRKSEAAEVDSSQAKHFSILQKLQKVKKKIEEQPKIALSAPLEDEAPISLQGLEPLPQKPLLKGPKQHISLASSLPPWLANPICVSPTASEPFQDIEGLSPKFLQKLASLELTNTFAVQSAVLPLLLSPGGGDVCISAATGSGKTLSYILPIVSSLSSRIVTRLRAVVIVPTRELVGQVSTVASSLCAGTGLKIGTAIGSRCLASEQTLLVTEDGASKVDILITTPGRLVEHVRSTPGFSLKWLKWCVVDEVDRLLAQSFQEWVEIAVGSIESGIRDEKLLFPGFDLAGLGIRSRRPEDAARKVVLSATMTKDVGKLTGLKLRRPTMVVVEDAAVAPAEDAEMKDADQEEWHDENDEEEGNLDEIFMVPNTLKEYAVAVKNIEYKPLVLLYLLCKKDIKSGVLVFVKSNEAAARLVKLIETMMEDGAVSGKWKVGLVSGEMEKKRREKVLKGFRKGDVDIIISSDLLSRGLDLPNVTLIVNYDIPASTRSYIHRVGRTARAGKVGEAYTLLVDKEARWFWRNIGKGIKRGGSIDGGKGGIKKVFVGIEEEGEEWRDGYERVLWG